jgi:hypothetical protein
MRASLWVAAFALAFVLTGLGLVRVLDALLLALHRVVAGRATEADSPLTWRDAPKLLITFHAICLPWVFFRTASFADATAYLARLVTGSWLEPWPLLPTFAITLCFGLHGLERYARPRLPFVRSKLDAGWAGALVEGLAFGALVALAVAASGTGVEFIYFQL